MKILSKNELDEMIGGDITSSGNDRNVTNNSEIETGPVDKPYNDDSEYEKGMPTTTDKVTMRYRQDIPWFAVYSYNFSRNGMTNMSTINENKPSKIIKKAKVEEEINDLVKKSKTTDVTDKNYDPKIANLIDKINDYDFTEEQLEKLKKALENKKADNKSQKPL